jgi:hypothetical protein
MNLRLSTLLFLLFTGLANPMFAQADTAQNLLFVKEGGQIRFDKNDYKPGKNAFYIYRNCVYRFVLKDKRDIMARIIDVRNDSLYYSRWINGESPAQQRRPHDTLALHPAQLKRIRLLGDQIFGLYSGYSLENCRYVFENNAYPKILRLPRDTVYAPDSSYATIYKRIGNLTAFGIDYLYEPSDTIFYFKKSTGRVYVDAAVKSRPIVKKGLWFSPTAATKVKGVNLGLQTTSIDVDGLTVQGVNISADLLSVFINFYGLFMLADNNLINMADTVDKSGMNYQIDGLSISGGGLIENELVRGVSINGGICTVTQANGLVITGFQNITEEFNGVMVTALRNKSVKGRGLQVGLLNICKDFKGIQIGLWNVNSKRRLPLINWRF